MSGPPVGSTSRFVQRAGGWGKVHLAFEPEFLDFKTDSSQKTDWSFRVPYAHLPSPSEYIRYRPGEPNILIGLVLLALTLLAMLAVIGPVFFLVLFPGIPIVGLMLYAVFRSRQKKPRFFTGLVTPSGTVLVWRDKQHEKILSMLDDRRTASLKLLDRIDPLADPQSETAKFRFLLEQGIISEAAFEERCEQLKGMSDREELQHLASTQKVVLQ